MEYVGPTHSGLKNKESLPNGSLAGRDLSDNPDYIFSYTQHPKENKKGFESPVVGFIRI